MSMIPDTLTGPTLVVYQRHEILLQLWKISLVVILGRGGVTLPLPANASRDG